MDEPRAEVGIESGGGDGSRPRPGLALRLLEAAGLVAIAFGFLTWELLWFVIGIGAIASSYAIYRKRHGRFRSGGSWGSGSTDGSDGGGDSGGGD